MTLSFAAFLPHSLTQALLLLFPLPLAAFSSWGFHYRCWHFLGLSIARLDNKTEVIKIY